MFRSSSLPEIEALRGRMRKRRTCCHIGYFAILVCLSVVMISRPSIAQTSDQPKLQPNVLWSRPLSLGPPHTVEMNGLVLEDLAKSPNRKDAVLLASRDGRRVILPSADETGPGPEIPLGVPPGEYRLLKSADGGFWLGGKISGSAGLASGGNVAYLARLEPSGKIAWEKRFTANHSRIDGMVLPMSGGVIVAGANGQAAWLARIADYGRVLWERSFGVSNSTAIDISGDDIVVAGSDAEDKIRDAYHAEAYVWMFKANGELIARKPLRMEGDRKPHSGLGAVFVASAHGNFYVVHGSDDLSAPRTLQVAKLDAGGQFSWQKEIESSLIHWTTGRVLGCRARLTVLGNGDPLMTCAFPDRIDVLRFSSLGNLTRASIARPSCGPVGRSPVFPVERNDRQLWLFNSPGQLAEGAICTFLATLPLDQLR